MCYYVHVFFALAIICPVVCLYSSSVIIDCKVSTYINYVEEVVEVNASLHSLI